MHSSTERGRHCQSLDSDMLANNETSVIDEICESRAIRMLVDIRTEFSIITTPSSLRLEVGDHKIRLEKSGFRTWEKNPDRGCRVQEQLPR